MYLLNFKITLEKTNVTYRVSLLYPSGPLCQILNKSNSSRITKHVIYLNTLNH